MKEWESAIGLLATVATVVVLALAARGESERLAAEHRAWEARTVETGAWLFEQHCSRCHGRNATGGLGPPLDASSGLHGGELGPHVAWRLEELGWDRHLAYEYLYAATAAGRTVSTRPERYPGNRLPPAPAPTATDRSARGAGLPMAMPAWAKEFGGPLRPDQIDALARYLAAFPVAPTSGAAPSAGSSPTHRDARATSSPPASASAPAGASAAPLSGSPTLPRLTP